VEVGHAVRIEDLLGRLRQVRPSGEGKWTALCPGHDDHSHSLGITAGRKRWFVKCFATCDEAAILGALALAVSDVWYEPPILAGGSSGAVVPLRARAQPGQQRTPVHWYAYQDPETGQDTHRKVRYEPKHFSWESWQDGAWRPGGMPHVLYNLRGCTGVAAVWWCAGEKDCDRVHGLVAPAGLGGAVTNPEGESTSRPEYAAQIRAVAPECQAVFLPLDHDRAGYDRVGKVAPDLWAAGLEVYVVAFPDLPAHGDVSDWLDQCRAPDPAEALSDYVGAHAVLWTADLARLCDGLAAMAAGAPGPAAEPVEPGAGWGSKLEDPVAFLARVHPPRVALIAGLLPSRGFTIWSGKSKSLKSTTCLYVSLAMALGLGEVCGLSIRQRQRVLFVEEEDPEDRVQERMRGMLVALTGKPWDDPDTGEALRSHFRVRCLGGYRIDVPEAWADLVREIETWHPDIVCFDAARKLTRHVEFTKPEVLHRYTDELQRLQVTHGFAFHVIAHDRKGAPDAGTSKGDPFDLDHIAGGLDFQAEADVILRLVRFSPTEVRLVVRSKDDEMLGPYLVGFSRSETTHRVTLLPLQEMAEKSRGKAALTMAEIVGAVRALPTQPGDVPGETGAGCAATDIAAYIGKTVETVRRHLSRLSTGPGRPLKRVGLRRPEKGHGSAIPLYALVESGDDAATNTDSREVGQVEMSDYLREPGEDDT
jgi:hypothetical protein